MSGNISKTKSNSTSTALALDLVRGLIVRADSEDGVNFEAKLEGITELYEGLSIKVIFNKGITASQPTLNINKLGKIPIRQLAEDNALVNVYPIAPNVCIKLTYSRDCWCLGWRRSSAELLKGTVAVEHGGTGLESVTPGNYLVGGARTLVEKTPDEVMEHIGAAEKNHNHDNALAIYGTASGENIVTMDDVSPAEHNIDCSIKSKNLFPLLDEVLAATNGVTLSIEDNYYVLNGTATDNDAFSAQMTLEGGIYTFSLNNPVVSSNTHRPVLWIYDTSGENTITVFGREVNETQTVELISGTYKCEIYTESGITYDNFIIKPQLELGSEATDYTPPVTDLTTVDIITGGRNLLASYSGQYPSCEVGNSYTHNGITYTVNDDMSITVNGTATANTTFYLVNRDAFETTVGLPGGTYTLSAEWSDTTQVSNSKIYIYYYRGSSYATMAVTPKTFTISDSGLYFTTVLRVASGTTVSNLTCRPILNVGEVALPYELPKEKTTYTPNADGTVDGVKAISPNMTVIANTSGVILDCEYMRDSIASYRLATENMPGVVKLSEVANPADLVGQKTEGGGEIFNDYENNKAYSVNSSTFGGKNTAGSKGYKILGIKYEATPGWTTFTLDSLEGIDGGMHFSAKLQSVLTDIEIKGVDTLNNQIIVLGDKSQIPLVDETTSPDNPESYNTENYLIIIGRPDLGTHEVGFNAFSSGDNCVAQDRNAHAEGRNTQAIGAYAHAEGRDTVAGYAAHAEGRWSKSLGQFSHAEGQGTQATGQASHSEGYNSGASNIAAHAEGKSTIASGDSSHAEGMNTQAIGASSHAEGEGTIANETFSHAEGSGSKALGQCSHAEGYLSEATGVGSHAEGQKTKSFGVSSHAEGQETNATGAYSHAEGGGTKASGNHSHAEGNGSVASGIDGAHAEGYYTTASGAGSHAQNSQTQALGIESHAEGLGTIAGGRRQHVQGRYNIVDGSDPSAEGQYAHIVGNGASDSNRSNAHTVDWDGNAWFAGNVTVGPDKKELAHTDLSNIEVIKPEKGGTGLSKLTAGSFLVGNGTEDVTLKTPEEALEALGFITGQYTGSGNEETITLHNIPIKGNGIKLLVITGGQGETLISTFQNCAPPSSMLPTPVLNTIGRNDMAACIGTVDAIGLNGLAIRSLPYYNADSSVAGYALNQSGVPYRWVALL